MTFFRFFAVVVLLFLPRSVPAEERQFEIFFSNDTTNTVSCRSPFNPEAGPFREEFLRATVDEAAGASVQMLQPGLGWIPWWKSELLPMQEHVDWLERNGRKPNSYDRYVLDGGDLVAVFVDECRKKGVSPFVSLRMNDMHHVYRGGRETDPEKLFAAMSEFQFFADHPDWLLGPGADRDRRMQYTFDFARPEVVRYKLELIRELLRYDVDGLELDFMRHWALFHPERTTTEDRKRRMTELIQNVRTLLDESGENRRLVVRIPGYPVMYDMMGVDLRAWAAAGVDVFNISGHYYTDFQFDLKRFAVEIPSDKSFVPEIHFAAAPVPKPPGDKGPSTHRRTTEQQIATAAHVASKRGAGGVSFFNFHYYRGTKNPTDVVGTPTEPPFHLLRKLRDPKWLAVQPQHYAMAFTFYRKEMPPAFTAPMAPGKAPAELLLDMAPPEGGWQRPGRLRIQSDGPLAGTDWTVSINDVELKPIDDVSEPFPPPSDAGLGAPADYRAWTVPAECLADGTNRIRLSLKNAEKPIRIFYVDIALP